ncbi:Ig-like domain-containing protein [Flammeovirga sp. EKP202]|uniref:Ig-like domain-containing protein n=1 Tax=Flammeovirga sp. EKP202 TaxID=2770592 RepID=UPI00165F1793|nr:Ig-like domain-containing protein [Flammeovirga sp. EKP202]MBD0402845.1 PKD domain-containing protein [Flammeovirga sp. EKP202]
MIKNKYPILFFFLLGIFLVVNATNAQINTFTQIGSSPTQSVILSWDFEVTAITPSVSDFTVKELVGNTDITSSCEVTLIENTPSTDYTVYVNLGGNYADGVGFSLTYDPLTTTSADTYTIDISAGLESNATQFSLNSISDLGELNNDGVTSLSNLLFTINSTATNIVYLKSGLTTIGTTIATGSADLLVSSTLGDGDHIIYAYGEDTNGDLTFTSQPVTVTIDTSVPSTPGALDLKTTSDSGSDNSDDLTNDDTPELNVASLPVETGNEVVFESDIDGEVGRFNYSASPFDFSLNSLTDGTHSITCMVVDSAGNEGLSSAALSITIDTSVPSDPVLSFLSTSDTGRDDEDGKTNDDTPVFNVVSESGTTIELFEDTNSNGTLTSTGDDDITATALTTTGSYNFTVKVTDEAGNESDASNTEVVDYKSVSIGALTTPTLAAGSDSGTANDNKTNDQTPTYSFSSLDDSDDKELIISSNLDGEVARETITATNQDITLTTLSEGSHTLTFHVEDVYGNVGTSANISLEIDVTPPTLTSVTIVSDNSSNTSMVADGDESTLTFVSDETLQSSFNVTLGGISVTPSKSGFTYTAARTFSTPGAYTNVGFSIPVVDQAGNAASNVTATTNSSTNTFFPALTNTITAPATTTYCNSDNYTYTITGTTAVGGSGVYAYSWQRRKDAGSYTNLNSYGESYTETSGLSSGVYTYRRVVTSEGIVLNSNTISININADISSNTISSTSATGYCNTITANALVFTGSTPTGGNASYAYQWQMSTDGGDNWGDISGTSISYTHSPVISSAGTYMFRRRVRSGGCESFSNTLTYVLTSNISNNTITNSSGTLVCLSEPIIIVGSSPSGGNTTYSYQWQQSLNGGGYTNISGATSQSYFLSSVSTAGNYTFRRIVTSENCTSTSSATTTITVPSEPTGYTLSPTTTNYSDQQTAGVALAASGLGAGENFYCSGPGVVSTGSGPGENSFYPNLAGQGTHIVNYHITKGGCEKINQVSFTVYDGSSVINLNPLYCEDDAAVALSIPGGTPSFVGGVPPYTLVRFEGTGTSGSGTPSGATFTPATVVTSTADGQDETVTITAVYQDNTPLVPLEFSVSQAVTVTKNHVAAINMSQLNYCIDASDFNVTANVDGSLTTDGTFRLDSNIPRSNPITISPSSLSLGSHTLTYTYTDGNGCSASDVVNFSINPLPSVSFDYTMPSDDGDFCFDADTVFLQGKSGGTNVSSGVFSSSDAMAGAVISYGDGTGAFIPSLANGDEFDLNEDFKITFTYTDGNSCANAVDSTVTVYGYDEVTLARSSASDSVCYSEGDVTITPMEGGAAYSGTGVTWSIDTGASGITTQMDGTILFHPSVAATNAGETSTSDYSTHIITYSYENTEGCTREVKDTLYVKPLPVLPTLISSVPSYCSQDTGLQDLEVSGGTGAQFAWSSDASFSTILSTSNTLTPADVGIVSTVTTISYWVRQTNSESCTSAPLKVDITVYPKAPAPTLAAGNQTIYCSGATISSLSVATPGNSIKWYSDAGLTTQVGFGDSFTPAINTNVSADSTVTFYVTETTNGCEGLPTSTTLTIYKTPDPPTFNPVTLLCSGDALSNISIASGSNVRWYSDASATTLLGSGNNYLPSFGTDVVNDSTVTIYATSTLNGCESSTSSVDININALPAMPTVPTITPYCEGDVITAMTAAGETGALFEWYSDETLSSLEATTATYDPMMNAPSYPTLDTLNFWVIQIATDGCESEPLEVDIPVYPRPVAPTLSASNQLIYCSGEVINQLSVATPGNSIKWYSDAGLTNQVGFGDDFTPAVNTNVAADSTVTYYVTETTNGCEGASTSTTLTIYKTPDVPTFNPVSLVCSGGALSTISIATGSNIRWYAESSKSTLLGTGNTYLPSFGTTVVNDSTVTFYATSTLNGCESVVSSVDININALPALPTVPSISPYCEGDALSAITASGESDASFEWYSDESLISRVATTATFDPMTNAPSYPTLDTLNYWVLQIASDGCISPPYKVDIPVYPRPVAPLLDASNQLVYCSGDIVTSLSVATAGNNIKWYSDAGLTNQVGFGDDFTPAINTNVSADSTVTYYVTETTNGCEGAATSTTITIYRTPDIPTFNPVSLICSGDPLPNLSIATGVNIKWYSDASKTTLLGMGNNYLPTFSSLVEADSVASLYATSTLNGCESGVGQIDISINALPEAPVVAAIAPYCEDDLIQPISASGESNANYEWYTDESLTLRISTDQVFSPEINAPSFASLDTIHYWVVQITPDGCSSLPTQVDIPVYPTPTKPVVDNRAPIYCSGDEIQPITVTSGTNIRWYDDALLSSIVSTNTSFTPPDPNSAQDYTKTYYITQTVNGCESDTTEVTMTINRRPEIPTVAATLSYCSGDILQPMIVSSIVEDVTWYSDADLTNVVGTTNSFTPTDPTSVTETTTYTYYVTDSHLGCEGAPLQLDIVIHPLPLFDLFGIDEGQVFCQSDDNPLVITTVSGGVLTSSTGALIRSNNEVVLENSPLGNHTIRYTYTNENNCVNYVERNFTIVDVPDVKFNFDVFCDTKVVQFRDLTTTADSTVITSWFYDFGAGEGSKYITSADSAASYEHTFSTSGFKTVTLTVETNAGCTNISTSQSIYIGTPPNADFEWKISEFGADMEFEEVSSVVDFDTLSTWEWDFGDGTSAMIDATTNANGAITHKYSQVGTYDVDLTVTTKRGCSKVISKSVYVIPRVYLTNEEDEYFEDFNGADGGWIPRGTASSWEHGVAQGENIITDTKVWVTNLTTNYNVSEDSYLNTPSFDISGLSRPAIIFDMQLDAEAHIDGVTLQYSLDSGQTWNVLGDMKDPIGWFNSSNILSDPGNQVVGGNTDSKGWTGNTEETGGIFRENKSIRHNLDQFIGEEHLRLRFAFKSNSDLEDEGVSIDNVFIGNRKKVVVVETMTNAGQQEDSRELPDLDSVLNTIDLDVLAINYHIKVDGKSDSLNIDNPEPSSGRRFYYGVTDAPSTIVDGSSFSGHTEDFIDNYQNIIATRALLDPKFDIDISLPNPSDPDEIEVTLTSNANFSGEVSEIVVHVVTVESEIFGVEVSEGVFTHHSVMKSMSPAPGAEGTSFFGRSWSPGSQETFTVAWDNPQVYDTDKAEVIVFVQDNTTKEIFQAIRRDVSHLVSTDPKNVTSNDPILGNVEWTVYPNPTSGIITVKSPNTLFDAQWVLTTLAGLEIKTGNFSGNNYSINLEHLPSGVYYLNHFDQKGQIGKAQKVVVMK